MARGENSDAPAVGHNSFAMTRFNAGKHYILIREHALGEAMTAGAFESVARYEVHLDRKPERTLAMLLKLKDLRREAAPA